jgi:hypothetical protein
MICNPYNRDLGTFVAQYPFRFLCGFPNVDLCFTQESAGRGARMLRRFYFDVGNGRETIRDEEGVEAEDLEQALADARGVIGEKADDLSITDLNDPWTLVVRDERGVAVAHVPIGLFSSSHRMPRRG